MQHLNRHMKVKHPSIRNTVVKVFECPMCEYVTSTEFQYKRHLRVIFFRYIFTKSIYFVHGKMRQILKYNMLLIFFITGSCRREWRS